MLRCAVPAGCRDILAQYDVTKDARALQDLEPLLMRRVGQAWAQGLCVGGSSQPGAVLLSFSGFEL